jgi:hypothetical protein
VGEGLLGHEWQFILSHIFQSRPIKKGVNLNLQNNQVRQFAAARIPMGQGAMQMRGKNIGFDQRPCAIEGEDKDIEGGQ